MPRPSICVCKSKCDSLWYRQSMQYNAYFPRILTCLRAHTRHHKPPLRGGPPQAGEADTPRGARRPRSARKKRLKINVINAFPHLPQKMAPQPPWPPSANLGHPKCSIQGGVALLGATSLVTSHVTRPARRKSRAEPRTLSGVLMYNNRCGRQKRVVILHLSLSVSPSLPVSHFTPAWALSRATQHGRR